ncbi:MAG: hypothetical protein AAB893_03990, partial [Patescibacteria group bacterium]
FLGEEYTVKYEEHFTPSEEILGFEDGSEIYEYIVDVDGEEMTYEYTATGYTIVNEDGESLNVEVYSEGSYETIGGDGKIKIDTFGFEIDPVDGEKIIYEYSPEFKNYVSTNGQIYVPPQGASYHYQSIDYNEGIYEYSSGGEKWAYDSNAGVWTSDNGAVYTPYVMSVAPTGYENDGRYESESGKVWNYDNGAWRSDGGDKWVYSQTDGTWKNPDSGVAYNPSLTYQTYNYYESDSSSKTNYQSYTTYVGVAWSFDDKSNSWVSSTVETYYVPSYDSYDMGYHSATETGGNTEGYSYGYYGYQVDYTAGSSSGMDGSESGATWSYDTDTGGWKSSSGETYYTPVSTNYYSPSYTSGSSS